MTQSRELLRSKEHSLTTSAIVSKWLTFTYCNCCEGDSWSTWKFLKPPFLFQLHPKPPFPVLTSELFSLLLLPFALRFHKLKLQTADKTWTSPFDNLIKAMAFLPEKWSHAWACARMCVCVCTCTHTHTHTHTGSTGFPIISGSLQTSWILPTVSEWEPQPLVTWEAFSSSAFARGKELFLFPCAWENYRSYLIIGESQPTKPHACCFRSWSFCSFQPKMALSFREQETL